MFFAVSSFWIKDMKRIGEIKGGSSRWLQTGPSRSSWWAISLYHQIIFIFLYDWRFLSKLLRRYLPVSKVQEILNSNFLNFAKCPVHVKPCFTSTTTNLAWEVSVSATLIGSACDSSPCFSLCWSQLLCTPDSNRQLHSPYSWSPSPTGGSVSKTFI